jgi:hypothetical protein
MLDVNASAFLRAATEIRRLNTVLEITSDKSENLMPETRQAVQSALRGIIDAIAVVGARAARVSAERFLSTLNQGAEITLADLDSALHEIEGRFADELTFIKMFIIADGSEALLADAESLVGGDTAESFRSIWYDIEESAKCICLSRSTASVFHAMRVIEIGIQAFSRYLEIPEPITTAKRNWSNILNDIRNAMDIKYPKNERLPGSIGSELERIYVTLDAIRNPWRNSTMHV